MLTFLFYFLHSLVLCEELAAYAYKRRKSSRRLRISLAPGIISNIVLCLVSAVAKPKQVYIKPDRCPTSVAAYWGKINYFWFAVSPVTRCCDKQVPNKSTKTHEHCLHYRSTRRMPSPRQFDPDEINPNEARSSSNGEDLYMYKAL